MNNNEQKEKLVEEQEPKPVNDLTQVNDIEQDPDLRRVLIEQKAEVLRKVYPELEIGTLEDDPEYEEKIQFGVKMYNLDFPDRPKLHDEHPEQSAFEGGEIGEEEFRELTKLIEEELGKDIDLKSIDVDDPRLKDYASLKLFLESVDPKMVKRPAFLDEDEEEKDDSKIDLNFNNDKDLARLSRKANQVFSNHFLNFTFEVIFSILLLFSANFYLPFLKTSFVSLLTLFSVAFSLEYIITAFVRKHYVIILAFSFGLINALILGVSFAATYFSLAQLFSFSIYSMGFLFLDLFLVLIVRTLSINYMLRLKVKRIIKRGF